MKKHAFILRLIVFCLSFILCFSFTAPALALLLRVTHEITFSDEAFSGLQNDYTVFGINSGPMTIVSSFLIDTEVTPFKYYGIGDTFADSEKTALGNFYGYNMDSISYVSVSFGSKTWDKSDIRLSAHDDDVAVWFDTQLISGATPSMSMDFLDSDGFFGLGGTQGSGGGSTIIKTNPALVSDFSTSYFFVLFQNGAVINVSEVGEPVPEPATMLLLGSGLVGLAGFRRKFKK